MTTILPVVSDGGDIERRIERLENEIAALSERLENLETDTFGSRNYQAETDPVNTQDSDLDSVESEMSADGEEETGSNLKHNDSDVDSTSTADSTRFDNLEKELGGKLLGILGAVALVVGVGFAVRYVTQQNMVSYLARALLGISIGIVLAIGGGLVARRTDHERWGWTVAGGGVAIAYYSLYASYALRPYREAIGHNLSTVIIGLSLIVTATALVSVYEGKRPLAYEAFLLGFVTAFFTPSDITMAAYSILLTAGIAAVVLFREWEGLALGGTIGAHVLGLYWVLGNSEHVTLGIGYSILVFVWYSGLAARHSDDKRNKLIAEVTAILSVLGFLNVGYVVIASWNDGYQFLPPTLAGITFIGITWGALSRPARVQRLRSAPTLGTLALILAAGYIHPYAGTIVGIAAVPILVTVGLRTKLASNTIAAHIAGAVIVYKLYVYDIAEYGSFTTSNPLSPTAILLLGVAATAAYLTHWLLEANPEYNHRFKPISSAYFWIGGAFVGTMLLVQFSGYVLSGSLAAVGFALLVAGFVFVSKRMRLQGLLFLAVATTKVFVFDLSGLDTFPRIVSFIVLGIILLAAALAYSFDITAEDPISL